MNGAINCVRIGRTVYATSKDDSTITVARRSPMITVFRLTRFWNSLSKLQALHIVLAICCSGGMPLIRGGGCPVCKKRNVHATISRMRIVHRQGFYSLFPNNYQDI